MKKIKLLELIVIILIIITGCATTSISYFSNLDIKISSFKKIMVFAPFQDIGWRKIAESNFVKEFSTQGKNAVSCIEVISPVEEYTDEEIISILHRNAIDSVLIISLIDAHSEKVYIPQKTTTHYRSYIQGSNVYSEPYTQTSGGYSLSFPKASFEINIIDVKSGKIAMKATANSKGNEFSDMKTIFKSLAKKIVSEYMAQP